MNRYTKPTLQKLEQALKELEYTVRYEKGTFNSGYCMVENTKVVVVNKFFDTDARVSVLLDILAIIMPDDQVLSEKTRGFVRQLFKSRESLNLAK
jgi:hypothetical protein